MAARPLDREPHRAKPTGRRPPRFLQRPHKPEQCDGGEYLDYYGPTMAGIAAVCRRCRRTRWLDKAPEGAYVKSYWVQTAADVPELTDE